MSQNTVETLVIDRVKAAEEFIGLNDHDAMRAGIASSAIPSEVFVHHLMDPRQGLVRATVADVLQAVTKVWGDRISFDSRLSGADFGTVTEALVRGEEERFVGLHLWPVADKGYSLGLQIGRTAGKVDPTFYNLFLSREDLDQARRLRAISR